MKKSILEHNKKVAKVRAEENFNIAITLFLILVLLFLEVHIAIYLLRFFPVLFYSILCLILVGLLGNYIINEAIK